MLRVRLAAGEGNPVVQDRCFSVLNAPQFEADAIRDQLVGTPDDEGVVAVGIRSNLNGHGMVPLV